MLPLIELHNNHSTSCPASATADPFLGPREYSFMEIMELTEQDQSLDIPSMMPTSSTHPNPPSESCLWMGRILKYKQESTGKYGIR